MIVSISEGALRVMAERGLTIDSSGNLVKDPNARPQLTAAELERQRATDAMLLPWKGAPANSPAEQNRRERDAITAYNSRMRSFWQNGGRA
jgi:hypothetical protein